MSTVIMEHQALEESLTTQPVSKKETSQDGKQADKGVSEEPQLMISNIVSLSGDTADLKSNIQCCVDDNTAPRSENHDLPSSSEHPEVISDTTEVVIVSSQDQSTDGNGVNLHDVAETVIIQSHDSTRSASVESTLSQDQQQQKVINTPVRNVIDIYIDPDIHENLMALKRSTKNLQNSGEVTSEQDVSVGSSTESSSSMVTRSMSGALSKDVFNCEECDYSSHNKHYLKQHVDLVHNEERPYKCPFCEYAGKRSHSLREHLIVHSNERPFECSHCNATFRKKGHLTNHIKLHQKTVNCPLCQKSIAHSDVEAHIKNAHNSEKLFVCEICSHVASDQEGIMKHLQKHKNQQIYICSSCNFMTPDFNTFLKHAESHAEADKVKSAVNSPPPKVEPQKQASTSQSQQNAKIMIVCSECRYVAPNAEIMKNHMWNHINRAKTVATVTQNAPDKKSNAVTPTKLPATNVNTSKASQDSSTSNSVSSALPPEKTSYKCVECDFVCTEAYGFVVHMLSHRPELQHQAKSSLLTAKKGHPETLTAERQNAPQQQNPAVLSKLPETKVTFEATPRDSAKKSNQISPPKQKMVNNPEKLPFFQDAASARFHCTICGYSCEYQRTIKAHIWKHSGNKNIDYPMFQNGPLSIYDDTPISKEEVTVQDSSNNKTVLVEVLPKPRPSLKSPVFEKYKNVKHDSSSKGRSSVGNVSTVSTVAPALAHLLAARAIAGLKQKTESSQNELEQQKKENTALSPIKNELPKHSDEDSQGIKVKEDKVHSEVEDRKNDIKTIQMNNLGEVVKESNDLKTTDLDTDDHEDGSNVPGVDEIKTNEDKLDISDKVKQTENPEVDLEKCLSRSDLGKSTDSEKSEGSRNVDHLEKEKEMKQSVLQFVIDAKTAVVQKVTTVESHTNLTSSVISSKASCPVSLDGEGLSDLVNTERKRKNLSPVEDGEIQVVAKRFCTANTENNQSSVVVETVDSISTDNGFTGMTSQQNSPRIIETLQTEVDCGDSGVASDLPSPQGSGAKVQGQSKNLIDSVPMKRKSSDASEDSVVEKRNCNVSDSELMDVDDDTSQENLSDSNHHAAIKDKPRQRTKSMAESAVTLLSLLKKGPNPNPACPVVSIENPETDALLDINSQESQQSGSVEGSPQPKTGGISSSLLAVIEQLRERSQAENEIVESSLKRHVKKKIRRESIENVTPIDDVDNVEEFVEGKVTKYRCRLCHYSNTHTYVIKQHMKLHKTKQPFECSLCDFMAESSESLQDHMIKHCKVRTYQCKLCSSAFNYKSQLRAHMRAHNEDVFVCDYCDFESTNPMTFRNHVRAHNEKKQYKCEVCEKRFLTKYDLRSHKRGSCSKQRSFFCDVCDFVAIGPQEQKSHAKIHHKEFKCGKCDYVSTSITRFQTHTRSHEEPKVLKCELCDFPAVSNRSLKSHMKRHINDQRFVQQPLEQYKCNLCGYVCHHLPSLKSHMWRHASDQNYSYEFTNEVINAAIDYDGRLDSEECKKSDIVEFNQTIGEKMKERLEGQGNVDMSSAQYAVCWVTFRCCQCGFETINKAELNLHMKSHSDVIQWTLQVSQNNSNEQHRSHLKRKSETLKATASIS